MRLVDAVNDLLLVGFVIIQVLGSQFGHHFRGNVIGCRRNIMVLHCAEHGLVKIPVRIDQVCADRVKMFKIQFFRFV